MKHSMELDKLTLGVCYYPEHWNPDMWEDDLARMVAHGIEVIRIAEFAWSLFEPEEGKFTFDFFDSFMAVVSRFPIRVIFCTPGATPPAWLTEKYPEVLNADIKGNLYRHGMRRHVTYNSAVYNRLCSHIAEQLAIHYGRHPSIIGWQVDNELNCDIDIFYSDSDHAAFRQYLQGKYGTLEELNRAWGNVFWNQTYTSWEQVHLSRHTVHGFNNPHPGQDEKRFISFTNPHLALDEKRFISESAIRFCQMHSEILRKNIDSRQFITTNGIFKHLDYHTLVNRSLDFITYDSYPNFAFSSNAEDNDLRDRAWGLALSNARSISPVFGVMEQQTGPNGWINTLQGPSPKPGQMRLWTFQSIANGADYIGYFRWRTCTFGTEIYWHGLNNYDNRPNRRLAELQKIHLDILKIKDINGALVEARHALVRTHAIQWDAEEDCWYGPLLKKSEIAWFAAFTFQHVPMDIIYLDDESSAERLDQYDLLVFPHAAILSDNEANLLKAYVKKGGTLIVGARSGYKDINGQCPMSVMPGKLREVCGASVADFTMVTPSDDKAFATMGDIPLEMPGFNDILEVEGELAAVLARYHGTYYDNHPAIIENRFGAGRSIYFGAAFTEESATILLKHLRMDEPYRCQFSLPRACELMVRRKNNDRYYFIMNFSAQEIKFVCKLPMVDLLSCRNVEGVTIIPPYDVMVLKEGNLGSE